MLFLFVNPIGLYLCWVTSTHISVVYVASEAQETSMPMVSCLWTSFVIPTCTLSLSHIAIGPACTYFSGNHHTTVDYCLLDSWGTHLVMSCQTIKHHLLNFFDRVPLSVHLDLNPMRDDRTSKARIGLNWRKARSDGSINVYIQKIHNE